MKNLILIRTYHTDPRYKDRRRKYPKWHVILKQGQTERGYWSSLQMLGSTENNPATSCEEIKYLNHCSKSGYYWIKPRCGETALKGYCDFAVGNWNFYYFYGKKQGKQPNLIDAKSQKGIQLICAKLGLFPVELSNYLRVIRMFVFDQRTDTEGYAVPLGYDYACHEFGNQCSGKFKSFNHRRSDDMKTEFDQDLDVQNGMNDPAYIIDNPPDAVGIYGSFNKITYFQMDQVKDKIAGVVCGDNQDSPSNIAERNEDYLHITCFDRADTHPHIKDHHAQSYLRLSCPQNCKNFYLRFENLRAYGHNPYYASQSSICLAALHAGAIQNDLGGHFQLGFNAPLDEKEEYIGSLGSDDIQSETIAYTTNFKSFLIHKVDKRCPIEYVTGSKDAEEIPEHTFLQIGQKFKRLTKKMKFKKNGLKEYQDYKKTSTLLLKSEWFEKQFGKNQSDTGSQLQLIFHNKTQDVNYLDLLKEFENNHHNLVSSSSFLEESGEFYNKYQNLQQMINTMEQKRMSSAMLLKQQLQNNRFNVSTNTNISQNAKQSNNQSFQKNSNETEMRFKSSNKLKEIADINNFTSDEILAMKDRYGYSKAKKEGKMNPLPSLKDAFIEMEKIYLDGFNNSQYLKFNQDTKKLYDKILPQLMPYFNGTHNPWKFEIKLVDLRDMIQHSAQTQKETTKDYEGALQDCQSIYDANLKHAIKIGAIKKAQILNNIPNQYKYYSSPLAQDAPSKWDNLCQESYIRCRSPRQENIDKSGYVLDDGHEKSLECIPTAVIPIDDEYWNAQIEWSWQRKSNDGYMGLLFRYSDAYNWYSVEYHENKLQLSVMIGGEIEEGFAVLELEGYDKTMLYDFQLTAWKNKFQVKMSLNTAYDQIQPWTFQPVVLKGEHDVHKRGRSGFFTDGMHACFSNYKYRGLACDRTFALDRKDEGEEEGE